MRADPSKGDPKLGKRKFFRSLKEALTSVLGLKAKQEKLIGAEVKLPKIRTMKHAADIAAQLETQIEKAAPIVAVKSEATLACTSYPLPDRTATFRRKELDPTGTDLDVDNGDKPETPKNGKPFNSPTFLPLQYRNKWSLRDLVRAIDAERDTGRRTDLYNEYKARLAEPGRLVRKMSLEKNPEKKLDFYRQYQLALARLK